jgi:Zn finger protein HypA/HybF involved in hydrogenase expression
VEICPCCKRLFEPTIKYGYKTKFCSKSCANTRTFSEEAKLKKKNKSILWYQNLSEEANVSSNHVKSQKIKKASKLFEQLGPDTRRRLVIQEQNNQCNKCKLSEWLGEPLTLEIDHMDGNNRNNFRENLEALCPNCHSLTLTWRGRNKTKKVSDEELIDALSTSSSIRQALIKVGLSPKGKNYIRAVRLRTVSV